jgi:DNA-directed RNA polymerase subunit RPC12/RpoP
MSSCQHKNVYKYKHDVYKSIIYRCPDCKREFRKIEELGNVYFRDADKEGLGYDYIWYRYDQKLKGKLSNLRV